MKVHRNDCVDLGCMIVGGVSFEVEAVGFLRFWLA